MCSRLLISRCSCHTENLSGPRPTGSQYQGSILLENLLSCGIQQVSQIHLDSLGKLSEDSQEPPEDVLGDILYPLQHNWLATPVCFRFNVGRGKDCNRIGSLDCLI